MCKDVILRDICFYTNCVIILNNSIIFLVLFQRPFYSYYIFIYGAYPAKHLYSHCCSNTHIQHHSNNLVYLSCLNMNTVAAKSAASLLTLQPLLLQLVIAVCHQAPHKPHHKLVGSNPVIPPSPNGTVSFPWGTGDYVLP